MKEVDLLRTESIMNMIIYLKIIINRSLKVSCIVR